MKTIINYKPYNKDPQFKLTSRTGKPPGADRGRDARDVRDALTSYVPHEVGAFWIFFWKKNPKMWKK